jgi:hypothetical protein
MKLLLCSLIFLPALYGFSAPYISRNRNNAPISRQKIAALFSTGKPDIEESTKVEAQEGSKEAEASDADAFGKVDNIIQSRVEKHMPEVNLEEQYLSLSLAEHKPLGCTAEESLSERADGLKLVFISKRVEGGNAEKSGLQVGDVIVGLSGSFDDLVDVFGEGLDRVRSLVAGRPVEKDLVVKVLRGTSVLDEHERVLIDICITPDGDGKDATLENCINALYQSDYAVDDVVGPSTCDDADTECMLDAMADVWGDELSVNELDGKQKKIEEEKKEKKPAPWSSRSSPSGTFVRDPTTGKMVNIDE